MSDLKLDTRNMTGIVQHQLADFYEMTTRKNEETRITLEWPRNEKNEGNDVEERWYRMVIEIVSVEDITPEAKIDEAEWIEKEREITGTYNHW